MEQLVAGITVTVVATAVLVTTLNNLPKAFLAVSFDIAFRELFPCFVSNTWSSHVIWVVKVVKLFMISVVVHR